MLPPPLGEFLFIVGLLMPGWLLLTVLEKLFTERFSRLEELSGSILLSSTLVVVPMTILGYLQVRALWQFSVVYEALAISIFTLLVFQKRGLIVGYLRFSYHQRPSIFQWTLIAISIGFFLHLLMHPLIDWDAVQLYLLDALGIIQTNVIPSINPVYNAPTVFPPFTSVIYAWTTFATGTQAQGDWYYQFRFLPIPFIIGTSALLYHSASKWGVSDYTRKIGIILFLMSPLLLVHLDFYLYYSDLYFMFFAFGSIAWLLLSNNENQNFRSLAFLMSGISTGMASLTKPHGIFMPVLWLMGCFLFARRPTRLVAFSFASLLIIVAPIITGVPEPLFELVTSLSLLAVCVPILYDLPGGGSQITWKIFSVGTILAIGGYLWPLRNLILFKSFFGEEILTNYGTSSLAWANSLLLKAGVFNVPDGEGLFGSLGIYAIFIDVLFLPTLLLFRLIGFNHSRANRKMGLLVVWTLTYIVMWNLDVRHFSFRQLLPLLPIVVTLDAFGMIIFLSRLGTRRITLGLLCAFAGVIIMLNLPFIGGALRDFPGFLAYSIPTNFYGYYTPASFVFNFVYIGTAAALITIVAYVSVTSSLRLVGPVSVVGKVMSHFLPVIVLIILIASPVSIIFHYGNFYTYDLSIRDNFYASFLQVAETALRNSLPGVSVLTFGGWGIELFLHRSTYDMSRVYYLAQLQTLFNSNNITYILKQLRSLNLTVAIFPDSFNLPYFQAFWYLRYGFGSFFPLTFDNPFVFQHAKMGEWETLKLTNLTRFEGFVDILLADGNLTLGSAFNSQYRGNTTFGVSAGLNFAVDFSDSLGANLAMMSAPKILFQTNVTYLDFLNSDMKWHSIRSAIVNGTIGGPSGTYFLPVGILLKQFSTSLSAQEYAIQVNSVNASVILNGSIIASQIAHPIGSYSFQMFPGTQYESLALGWSNWTYST